MTGSPVTVSFTEPACYNEQDCAQSGTQLLNVFYERVTAREAVVCCCFVTLKRPHAKERDERRH